MEMTLVPRDYFEVHSIELSESEDRIACSGLTHYASRLLEKCFHDKLELEQSLQKAITALKAANLPISQHFRSVYRCGSELEPDWMMSDLGLRLLILNADFSNPLVGRLQVQILSDGFTVLRHD